MVIPQPAIKPAITLSDKRRMAGRLGGLQTYLRYGEEHMREIGRRGGQARLPTLEELKGRHASSVMTNKAERRGPLSGRDLLKAVKLRISSGGAESE